MSLRSSIRGRGRGGIGQLSGRVALVDGHADGDVETLLIPPDQLRALLMAEAYLGHRNIQHTVRYTELSPGRFKDFWR